MISDNAANFLLSSYFGIEFSALRPEDEDIIILKCAQRAYKDLCRTIAFRENVSASGLSNQKKKEIEASHREFRNEICQEIRRLISESLLTADVSSFDKRHNEACIKICCKAAEFDVLALEPDGNGEEKEFHYGQAQKWLNMTMKYMWLLGLWKDQFDSLISVVHIPVDRYIMEAIWKNDEEEKVPLPLCKGKKRDSRRKLGDDKVISWSKWEKPEYVAFQKALRQWCGEAPLEWEGKVWIEIARSRDSM